MKKILVLLCGLAFASGAWASYSYTFNVQIYDLPEGYQFTKFSSIYLIDKVHHQVLAYTRSNEYGPADPENPYGPSGWTTGGAKEHYEDEVTINGVTYKNVATTVNGKFSPASDGTSMGMSGTVEDNAEAAVNPLKALTQGKTDSDEAAVAVAKSLQAVIWDSSTGYYQLVERNGDFKPIGVTISSNGGNWTYGISATIYVDVPEPTSGLLMLIGVAGLALRRRRFV